MALVISPSKTYKHPLSLLLLEYNLFTLLSSQHDNMETNEEKQMRQMSY